MTRSERGQSMVEVVVAVGLILAAMTALLSLGVVSLRGASFGISKIKATRLANEELELVRAYRDTVGWAGFVLDLGECGSGCHIASDLTAVTSGTEPVAESFTRCFTVVAEGGSKMRITAVVNWTDQSGERDVTLSSVLADW